MSIDPLSLTYQIQPIDNYIPEINSNSNSSYLSLSSAAPTSCLETITMSLIESHFNSFTFSLVPVLLKCRLLTQSWASEFSYRSRSNERHEGSSWKSAVFWEATASRDDMLCLRLGKTDFFNQAWKGCLLAKETQNLGVQDPSFIAIFSYIPIPNFKSNFFSIYVLTLT